MTVSPGKRDDGTKTVVFSFDSGQRVIVPAEEAESLILGIRAAIDSKELDKESDHVDCS